MIWDLFKVWVGPGSLTFLLLLLAAGASLLRVKPARRLARIFIALVLVGYLALSLPWSAGGLARNLQGPTGPLSQLENVPRPVSIVVFGGDHADERIREAARLYAELRPQTIVLSGDEDLYAALALAGVPPERIIWDATSRTTREQAVGLGPLLRAHSVSHFVLVASPIHMRRALGAVRATGLCPIPSTSEVPRHWTPAGLPRFVPQWQSLRVSEEALYEYLALAYYWVRGWLQ